MMGGRRSSDGRPWRAGRRPAALLLAGLLGAAALAGCGRKGDLEPALDPSVRTSSAAAQDREPEIRRSRRTPIVPSRDGFILDPLL